MFSVDKRVEFPAVVWRYYEQSGRSLPWRQAEADGTFDAYKILVSEIMLQQTQVSRVIPKYEDFLRHYPTAKALRQAGLAEVLRLWSGLGYNRRAKYVYEAVQQLPTDKPWHYEGLVVCKGIGPNTAAAVCVYAYNQPLAFIETNIRTVFIHHFFADEDMVDDKALLPLVEKYMDPQNPREWYWALMDYGSYLKSAIGNKSRQSKQYVRQSPLEGSRRHVRGQVIRLLTKRSYSEADLRNLIIDDRLPEVLGMLTQEGLIRQQNGLFCLY